MAVERQEIANHFTPSARMTIAWQEIVKVGHLPTYMRLNQQQLAAIKESKPEAIKSESITEYFNALQDYLAF